MVNQQAIERQEHRDDGTLDVVRVWRTIQGEGPFTGCPAIFVRLAGCNLRCSFCDTDYTSQRRLYSVRRLIEAVRSSSSAKLVVITGGEPLRQNIGPFVQMLLDWRYNVQIETNGVLWQELVTRAGNCRMTLVCSPKTTSVHPNVLATCCHWKYVVKSGEVEWMDGLPRKLARPPQLKCNTTWVQPMDEQDEVLNKANLQAALDSCFKFGYRLSLQTHKMIGVD